MQSSKTDCFSFSARRPARLLWQETGDMFIRQDDTDIQRRQRGGKGRARHLERVCLRFIHVAHHHHHMDLTHSSHTAPVWQLAWAHPSFGSLLASCSYDGRVFIWKEAGPGQGSGSGGELQDGWERIKEHTLHTASGESRSETLSRLALTLSLSVNSIAWAPYDLGPMLACASSDGKISVLSFQSRSGRCRLSQPLIGPSQMTAQPTHPSSPHTVPARTLSVGHLLSYQALRLLPTQTDQTLPPLSSRFKRDSFLPVLTT